MKKYRLKITSYAREQLQEIRDYITYVLMSPDAAKNLITTIQADTKKLQLNPTRIKPVSEEPWGSQGIRKLIVKNYYIYFWIDEECSTVHIIAVTYGKRDQKQVLEKIEIQENQDSI